MEATKRVVKQTACGSQPRKSAVLHAVTYMIRFANRLLHRDAIEPLPRHGGAVYRSG